MPVPSAVPAGAAGLRRDGAGVTRAVRRPSGRLSSLRSLTHPAQSPPREQGRVVTVGGEDRKSTRLNSSHSQISYAVFCLKKKKKKKNKISINKKTKNNKK